MPADTGSSSRRSVVHKARPGYGMRTVLFVTTSFPGKGTIGHPPDYPPMRRAETLVVDASCDCDRCTSRTDAKYDLDGRCSNCGALFIVRSRKGDKSPLYVECPACEVTVFSWRRYS